SCLLALNALLTLLLVAADLASAMRGVVSLSLGSLVWWGMIVGHRLAWQWGRVLGIIAAVILTLIGIVSLTSPPPAQQPVWAAQADAAISLFSAACLYTIFFALGTASARDPSRLRCPACGRFTGTAADFLFNRARCASCPNVW